MSLYKGTSYWRAFSFFMMKHFLLLAISFFLGICVCLAFHQWAKLPIVVAASLSGFIFSAVRWPSSGKEDVQACGYAGAFVGMCSPSLALDSVDIVIISIVGTLFFTALKQHFTGVGGKLGAIAFTAVIVVMFTTGRV